MTLEDELKIFIETLYDVKIENNKEDLMDMGVIDSIMAVQLVTILEEKFDIKFSFVEYTKNGFFTINKLAESIRDKR